MKLSRLLLLGAMIALLLGMTFETPPPAFAQSTTLVSNLDRLSTLKPAAGIYAQGFRTGAHTAGYTIRNVQVRLAAGSVTSSTKTTVLIRQERNGEPGALVTALTTQTPLVDGVNTFAAPANTTLNPQTNYFITVNEATPPPTGAPGEPFAPGPRAVYELTGSREQSGADGWSIEDKRLYKNHLSQEWGTSDRIFLFISVNGDVHTPNTEQQVEIVPPTVDGTPSVSGAGTDAQWSVGETVGVTVAFSEAVDVGTNGGTPSVGVELGGSSTAARSAAYASGSGTAELVFGYTLVQGDGSHSLMAVTPNSLALNGGTIRSAESQTNAQLAHNGTVVQLGGSTEPEVSFQDVPESHDGATAFTVGVQFSGQPDGLSATRDAASVLEVTGGSVTGARVASKSADPAWEVTVVPDGLGEVTIEVPVRACTEANAVCIGGRSLSRAVETAVPGTPMTARFTQTPSAHDGSNSFELHMEFSHEPENFSYRTVQGALFDIEGGRIERVWRRERGKDRQWGIVVAPDGGGAVTLVARATTDCAAQNAVCDAEGGEVRGGLEPHGAGSGVVIAPRGIDCGVGDAGDGRHGGGVHALAHGGDGCRAYGDGVGLGERGVGERDAAHVGDVRRSLGQRDAERGDGGRRGSGGCEHGDGDGFFGLGLHGEWNLGVCGCRGGGRRRDAGGDDGLADRGGGERDAGGDAFGDGRGHGRGGSLLVDSGGRGRGRGCGTVRADGRRRTVVQGGEGLRGAGRCGHRRGV